MKRILGRKPEEGANSRPREKRPEEKGSQFMKVRKTIISLLVTFAMLLTQSAIFSLPASAQGEPSAEKNAYINGSKNAQNGTEDQAVRVELDDTISYEVTVNPPVLSTVSVPSFKSKAPQPVPINFLNGSFEDPVITGDSKMVSTSTPGFGWYNTAEEIVEIQKTPATTSNFYAEFAKNIPDGKQYAELNANTPGRLYQHCNTTPGTKVYWEFYHGARGCKTGENTDVMHFYLSNINSSSPDGYDLIATATDSYTKGSSTYTWGYYTGTWTVPQGQTITTSGRHHLLSKKEEERRKRARGDVNSM